MKAELKIIKKMVEVDEEHVQITLTKEEAGLLRAFAGGTRSTEAHTAIMQSSAVLRGKITPPKESEISHKLLAPLCNVLCDVLGF